MLVVLLLPVFCAAFAPPRPVCRPLTFQRKAHRAPRLVAMSAAAAPAGGLATSAVGATMLAVSLAKYLPHGPSKRAKSDCLPFSPELRNVVEAAIAKKQQHGVVLLASPSLSLAHTVGGIGGGGNGGGNGGA